MAAGGDLPIKFKELFQLQTCGIRPESVTFNTVTMESDKYICVREKVDDTAQVVMIDVEKPAEATRINMLATAVLMNPEVKVLALRAADHVQIFNLDMKSMMKEHVMSEEIQFWKWLDIKTLAIVTVSAVYHWSMEGDSAPQKICDRLPELANHQIINYRTSSNGTWVAVVGIAAKDSRVVGSIQLFSLERQQAQYIPGHACVFVDYRAEENGPVNSLFIFSDRTATTAQVHMVEIGRDDSAAAFAKKDVNVFYPAEGANDFPVAMQVSQRFQVVYLITKLGYIHLYDIDSGTCLYMNRISAETIFVTVPHTATGGIMGVNKKGQVLAVCINADVIVSYIQNTLNQVPMAVKWASRYGLSGADEMFTAQFQRMFASGDIKGAARIAAQSPRGMLRTPQTIQLFQNAPPVDGVPALLHYFNILLEMGSLNAFETIQLAQPVLAQGKLDLLETWLTQEKLACSEELGDLLKPLNATLALSVYLRAEASAKVVQCFAEAGEFDKIVVYSQRVGYTPDWLSILANVARVNPDGAKNLALQITLGEGGPKADVNQIVDVFARCSLVQQATAFLLEVLKPDREEDAHLQTRLLEMNLVAAPQVAVAILNNDMLHHYDKPRIAELCEKSGQFGPALENYTDLKDIIRILTSINPTALGAEFLIPYFGRLSVEGSLEALDAMLATNPRQNLQLVVQIATKYTKELTPQALIAMFERYPKSTEGLFFYLGSVVNYSDDPDVHFKYIEAAAKANQMKEVARICRDSNVYDPERTKNFLKEAQLTDQLPLIIVCDRFDFVDELTRYLYSNDMMRFIEIYVKQVNSLRAPIVIGTLLDLDCNEDVVRDLIVSVRNSCPPEELIEEVEKRMRLKLLLPWLEERVSSGQKDQATYNALAKIYIETSNDPERFLTENDIYDPRVVGRFCEKRDPLLAVVAYTKGQCDDELIAVTNENQLFKEQARYLVGRADLDLWAKVLSDENPCRADVIEAVTQTALINEPDANKMSTCVRAFMLAELPSDLIELLEKVVLDDGRFASNANLQNLLLLTAVKAENEQHRVKEYIARLDRFDPMQISELCIEGGLFEEAFLSYDKFNHHVPAITVLVDNLVDLERGHDYAKKQNTPEVWSTLAAAQVRSGDFGAGVDAYIKADDASKYEDVIRHAQLAGAYEDLVRFLLMARKKLRETLIETELAYAFARTDKLAELEDYINGPHGAQIQNVGERCFAEELYQAAKILFNNISNYARLATTLVRLGEFQAAVEAARKANNIQTWKEVNASCVEQEEFRLARICGLHIIVNAEELEGLVRFYEERGHFDEIIALIDGGLGDERAHTGMFTELSVLYSKYQPENLMEHLKMFRHKINIPKILRACEAAHLWNEMVFLYVHYEEYDNAVQCMIMHSAEAWEHDKFKDIVVQVHNNNVAHKAVSFYLREQPMLLVDLLHCLTQKADPARVVMLVRREDALPLIKPWLVDIQKVNVAAVNDALNELLIQEEDYDALRESIDTYDEFDDLELAVLCEKHDLLEFRRIAAYLYKKNERWDQSMELSQKDNLFKDAMITAADSKQPELAENLLRFFVEEGNNECFAACLFTCYDLLRPDVVMELGWRYRIMDYMMPYMIQVTKDYTQKVDHLVQADQARTAHEQAQEAADAEMGVNMMMNQMEGGPALLTYPGAGVMGGGIMPVAGPGMVGNTTHSGNYYVPT